MLWTEQDEKQLQELNARKRHYENLLPIINMGQRLSKSIITHPEGVRDMQYEITYPYISRGWQRGTYTANPNWGGCGAVLR